MGSFKKLLFTILLDPEGESQYNILRRVVKGKRKQNGQEEKEGNIN